MSIADDFKVLGLDVDAGPSAVSKAWRALAPSIHPDLGHSTEAFVQAKLSYDRAMERARKPRTCPDCDGKGQRPKKSRGLKVDWEPCGRCGGSGKVQLV